MKLSIWQQFSSNHSSDFTIVGAFDTTEAAEEAASIIRTAIQRIIAQYDQNDELRNQILNMVTLAPSPVEEEIAFQFGVSDHIVLDYLANCKYDDQLVQVYGNHVFVSNAGVQTTTGPQLFDQVMTKLGAAVALDVEAGEAVVVNITCTLPDMATGQQIIEDSLLAQTDQSVKALPWIVFHPQADYPTETMLAAKTVAQQYNTNTFPTEPETRPPFFRMLKQLNDVKAYFVQSQAPSGMTLDDTHLSIQGLVFSRIGLGLPAFIRWLETRGCTKVTFTTEQAKWQLPPGVEGFDL